MVLSVCREPYLQEVWDQHNNQENVDNDDGSGYYSTHDNFLVYGKTGLKCDFGGHDNHHFDNIYTFVETAVKDGTSQLDGHEDGFYRNMVIMTGEDVGKLVCNSTGHTIMHHNEYFTPSGDLTECGMPLAEWQELSDQNDYESTVEKWPDTEIIIKLAREKLNF